MTTPRTLPAVAVQSSPDYCWVCLGGLRGRVWCRPVRDGRPEPVAVPIQCPQCSGSADLLEVLGEVAR